ncbi:PQQ-dependent sugar dehydrogenase [Saccharothrix obliqua]|uniref:PQQ-dependent sugar dehydrogenase n=1 Tax=Saccharothrix obliqua TaxID=2861747 RepID=UPI001C5DF04A|nr:PQQ-dependent sugar dehydrogenase [Saccharothrix obliqua]MBW4719139.1 PQQ-dependent sugar dehydrogenase [Saccharothrix obliqua]
MRRSAEVATSAVLAIALTGCSPAPGSTTPTTTVPDLRVEVVGSGFTHPWEVGFLPDGRLLVTERPGTLALLDRGTRTEVAADLRDVVARGEGGLMGLVVHPDFASSHRFTTCFTTEEDIRLVTFELVGAEAKRVRDPLRAGLPVSPGGRHSGCRLALDGDRLLVGTGDTARPGVAQDRGSLGGKVLRLDLATGEGGVLTYGHRNVQGIAVRADGAVFAAEHGPDVDDEVNLLREGANYGWDPSRGGESDEYDESVPMTDLTRFPDAVPAVWSSGGSTEAVCDIVFLRGDRWGDLAGTLVATALKGTKALFFTLSPEGAVRSLATPEELTGAFGRLRGAALGPDDALYLTTSNGSDDKVLRVTRN